MKILLQPAFIIASLLFASQASAQFDTAEVLGAVKDPTGAGVPKADVTLRNQNTGIESKTVTGAEGGYNFFNVKVGKYTVTVEAQGFSRTSTADVDVAVGARQRVDLTLQVGNVYRQSRSLGRHRFSKRTTASRGR